MGVRAARRETPLATSVSNSCARWCAEARRSGPTETARLLSASSLSIDSNFGYAGSCPRVVLPVCNGDRDGAPIRRGIRSGAAGGETGKHVGLESDPQIQLAARIDLQDCHARPAATSA